MVGVSAAGPMRILVVGCGSIGRRHLSNLRQIGVADLAGVDVREDRRRGVASLGIDTFASLAVGLTFRPHAVVVATPPSLHLPMALEAAARGCHLFIEKPLADSAHGVDELLDVTARQRLVTLVGCNLRFHPGLLAVKELVDAGTVGRVTAARAEFGHYLPDWHSWEDYRDLYSARIALGGGVILDAIHEIDYLRWLLGEIDRVACFAGRLSRLEIETEDTASMLLRFATGAIGEVHLDYVQRSYHRSCQIVGDEGTIHWDYAEGSVRWYTAAAQTWQTRTVPAAWEPNQMYVDEMRHFVRCLQGEDRPALDVLEAARVLDVALAAKASAQAGEIVSVRHRAAPRPVRGGAGPERERSVVAVVQARMGSTRLPGKVLADIAGRPMLERVVERVRRASMVHDVIVATSTDPQDDPIAAWCAHHHTRCFRGSEADVLDRIYHAARQAGADVVVRVTADCPLIDAAVVDRVVARYLQGAHDYVTNTLRYTLPDGLDVEVFGMDALAQVWREARLLADREHVTTYFRTSGHFRIANVEHTPDLSALRQRWTVDDPADLEFVRAVYAALGSGDGFGLTEVLDLLEGRSELKQLNRETVRNEGYYRSLAREPALPASTRSLVRSGEIATRALDVIPSGTQTFSKGPTQFVQGVAPFALVRGQGSRVWDADGNEYIDYPMALGAIILGHNYPAVSDAVARQLRDGTTYSLPHPLETEVAELLVEDIPCAEMVRFAKNGSDATAGAVRAARAYTRRELIACCGYHGWQDWFIGTTSRHLGVPRTVRDLTIPFAYNDLPALERIFAEHPGQVAAVVMEPVGVTPPADGFLQAVRDLTSREGALLVFDEIITGYRLAPGGAQEYFGILPDLACFGKAMANGFPLSAVVGPKEIMRMFDEIFFSFTFGGDTLALAAARATIMEFRTRPVIAHLWETGQRLQDGYNVLAGEFGVAAHTSCIGYPPRTVVTFVDAEGRESLVLKSLLQQECLKRGVLFSGGHNICFSHTEADVDRTLRVYRTALDILADALRAGDAARRLEGPPVQPVFRQA